VGRQRRIEVPGGIYHVISRGSNRQPINFAPGDCDLFVRLLGTATEKHEWSLLAWCLVTNHFHLLLRIRETGLSKGMQWLNTGFSRLFNVRHGREAHLFRNRFFSKLVEREEHLLEACRYIVRNPVRAGLCGSPGDWPWSSYRATAGLERTPGWLAQADVLAFFGSSREIAVARYRAFVNEVDTSATVSDTTTAW
jgi:putative transposase